MSNVLKHSRAHSGKRWRPNYDKSGAGRGFVALMSVIIIGAMLSVLIFTLGVSTFFSRFGVLEAEYKRTSVELAEGCVHAAMLKIAQGTAVTVPTTVVVDSANPARYCKICSASLTGSIMARATYGGTYTNLEVTIDPTPGSFSVTRWIEKPANSDASCTLP